MEVLAKLKKGAGVALTTLSIASTVGGEVLILDPKNCGTIELKRCETAGFTQRSETD